MAIPAKAVSWHTGSMVKPSHARIASAESALRLPVGGGLGTGWVVWEGINKLWEHILLSWICDRLRDREGLVDFLKWTVAHPFWFLFALVVGYLAIVALKAMFGGTPESDSSRARQTQALLGSINPRTKKQDPPHLSAL